MISLIVILIALRCYPHIPEQSNDEPICLELYSNIGHFLAGYLEETYPA